MSQPQELLREFAAHRSEAAFRQLVNQYVDLVYSTALRRASGDSHLAEDIVQTVFADFARKAGTLPANVKLGGWLHRHCCFVASNMRRADSRRSAREQEAFAMKTLHPAEFEWSDLAPELDDAIEKLEGDDREAILLRFFEKQDFRAIGEALGATENAAQKRVARALEKLRELLGERGIAFSATALLALLSERSVGSAPATLAAKSVEAAVRNLPKAAVAAGTGAVAVWLWSSAAVLTAVVATVWLAVSRLGPQPIARSISAVSSTMPKSLTEDVRAANASSSAADSASTSARLLEMNSALVLRLTLVAADSGQPIPNVPISYKATEAGKWIRKDLIALRDGVCLVPFSTNAEALELVTRVEGFADTRLNWEKKRGDVIPESYTLRLRRGVKIGGKVLNARNELVSGAKVELMAERVSPDGLQIESHPFGTMVIAAEDGTWQTERLPNSMLTQIFGWASHPDYPDSDRIVQGDAQAAQLLRECRHIFRMADGVRVRGMVVNERDEPIPGATVLVGRLGEAKSRTEISGPDGRFDIGGCIPGKTMLTATAEGYAATTINAVADESNKDYKLTLKPGSVLKLRVVNAGGEPIPKSYVWLDTGLKPSPASSSATPSREFTNKPFAQVSPEFRTDAEGRLQWNDAPDQELLFDFDAKGYMRLDSVKISADGEEHVVTLRSGLRVHGIAKDAHTGLPIQKFQVLAGYPSRWPGSTNWSIFWNPLDRYQIPGTNGIYEKVFEEPVIHGVSENRFVFKVEAEGYKSAITRVVETNEYDVEFNIALEK